MELTDKNSRKPLGRKSYGSIAHLPNSRISFGDHHCHEGQERIATLKARDKHDVIIIQEKLDGTNVGVALLNGVILPITRAGYLANTSPFVQHHHFSDWVYTNESRFRSVLKEGERLCGEWLMQAHGTRYDLHHEPFVAFDLMVETRRYLYRQFVERAEQGCFITPHLVSQNYPVPVVEVMRRLGEHGHHGAIDRVEGAVWRVERKGEVDFLVKWVRPDKKDGIYLPEQSGKDAVWNWYPKGGQQ